MTLDETLAASRRLDRVLADRKDQTMPEFGASKLSGDLDGMITKISAEMDAVRVEIAGAVGELVQEVRGGKDVAKAIRAETMKVRATWSKVLGNASSTADESAADAAAVPKTPAPGEA